MSDLEVRIVKLEPMRVACVNGFGSEPETQAWEKMLAWIKSKGLLEGGQPHRFFGYNNPSPAPGSPNYGYDVWITVDETVQPEGEVRILAFPGGLYAVTRVEVKNPGEDIPNTWQKLVAWMEHSSYRLGNHQCLEESPNPVTIAASTNFTLDLYLPIVG